VADTSEGSPPGGRGLQRALIVLVGVLVFTLGVLSYQRVTGDEAAGSDTTTTTASGVDDTEAGPTTTVPTATSTTTAGEKTSSTTSANPAPTGQPPAPPADVKLVEIGPNTARIEWTSELCVGSRYQVGDFDEGGGGYPRVDRCWTDHVVLAGDPSFSPLLEPDTEYVVRIHAVSPDGLLSEPRFITIRTTPG
jgi:hypothetical protein